MLLRRYSASFHTPPGTVTRVPWQDSPDALLGIAVVLSLLLHAAGVAWLPGMRMESPAREEAGPLEVTLRFPPPEVVSEPSPPPRVEVVKPEPPRPKERPEPKPTPKPIARPVPEPRPRVEQDVVHPAPVEPASPPPAVVAVEPSPKAVPPALTVPVPPPVRERPVDDSMLSSYGDTLARILARYQHYPRIAQLRRWEGKVQLKVFVAKKGTITHVVVAESSGHEVLDQQAVEMVNRANPLPNMPEALQGREFTILVPVVFRLERS